MKIGLRGGHSPNCKGAIGILDEQTEVRKIYYEMVPMLQSAGHIVIDCNSNASTVGGELADGTNRANANQCDVYITIHMNASGGSGNGTECWLYNGSNVTMNNIADKILQNLSATGFYNRGRKYNTGYHDLRASKMPAMIVETMFCDNEHDARRYQLLGANGIAEQIARAIDGNIIPGGGTNSSTATPPVTQPTINTKNWVARLQDECNKQGFSNQTVDGIPGPITLTGCPVIKMGAQGNITKLVQERLNILGYNCGTADGIFGTKTRAAVTAFQRAKGLTTDGIVGMNTWSKLLEGSAT